MDTDTFAFGARQLRYHDAVYNSTRLNERAVEVPVGLMLLYAAGGMHTLEVGAVLPHYADNPHGDMRPLHTVVDLYEQYPGVINDDVLTWTAPCLYDLVISISTLEHLPDEAAFLTALERLRSWVAPDGTLFFTVPYGQPGAPWVIDWLERQRAETDMQVMRYDKIGPQTHTWERVPLSDPWRNYGEPVQWANSVVMFFWRRVING